MKDNKIGYLFIAGLAAMNYTLGDIISLHRNIQVLVEILSQPIVL